MSFFFWWMIDCAGVRSALLSCASDVISQRCMFLPSFPKVSFFFFLCTLLWSGHFSLWASSHLIKQAQEMSLLADWPCVFLFASSQRTLRHARFVSVGRETTSHVSLLAAASTFPSPLLTLLTPICSFSFSLHYRQKKQFAPTSPLYIFCSPAFHFSPLCPCPLPSHSASRSVQKTKQTWPIKSLSNLLVKVPYSRVMDN